MLRTDCSQTIQDTQVWAEWKPEVVQFIELGTGNGVFSKYLLNLLKPRTFHTFDHTDCPDAELSQHYLLLDIIAGGMGSKLIADLISRPGKTLLFCDNGDKPLEVKLYSPFLKPGDILVVHDWMTEIKPEHIPIGFIPIPLAWDMTQSYERNL